MSAIPPAAHPVDCVVRCLPLRTRRTHHPSRTSAHPADVRASGVLYAGRHTRCTMSTGRSQEAAMQYVEVQVGGPHTKRRGVALIDAANAEAVSAYSWCMDSGGYAKRGARVGGKHLTVAMHRSLLGLGPSDPRQVDHINGNKLDNRRANLRVCSQAENHHNLHYCGPYRGASWHAGAKRWRARVRLAGKHHYLGYFDTQEDAAAVASAFRRSHMPFSVDAREAAA